MTRTKKLNIVGLICNLAVVVMVALGFYFMASDPGPLGAFTAESLKYYTVLTAVVTGLTAFLMIWSNVVSIRKNRDCTPRLFFSLREYTFLLTH